MKEELHDAKEAANDEYQALSATCVQNQQTCESKKFTLISKKYIVSGNPEVHINVNCGRATLKRNTLFSDNPTVSSEKELVR